MAAPRGSQVPYRVSPKQLRSVRDGLELSLTNMAKRLGVTRRHYVGMESGERPCYGPVGALVLLIERTELQAYLRGGDLAGFRGD